MSFGQLILVFLSSVVGAILGGYPGAIIGVAVGVVLLTALAFILRKIDGGILPRAVRERTARDFVQKYRDAFRRVYPDVEPDGAEGKIGELLEEIITIAMDHSPRRRLVDSLNLEDINRATEALARARTRPEEGELLRLLTLFLLSRPDWSHQPRPM